MKTLADVRRFMGPLAVLLLVLACAVLGLHRLALWQYDSLLGDRALHDVSLRLQQGTPFHWGFDDARELSGEVHGLGDYRFRKGVLHIEPANGDPHFSLALADRLIDSHYDRLVIRLTSSADTRLQVFHRVSETADFVFGSQWIDVHAGEQTLILPLSRLQWYAVAVSDRGRDSAKPDARWGGEQGVITELRIDPANRADVKLQIQDIALKASQPWPAMDRSGIRVLRELPAAPTVNDIVVLDARAFNEQIEWLRDHRHAPLMLADGTAMRTPELSLRLRNRVLREVPQAIWFPAVPDDAMLARIQGLSAAPPAYPDAHWLWSDYQQPAAIVAILLALLYGLCLVNPAGYPRLARATQAAILPMLAACVWVNARHLGSLPGIVSVLMLGGTGIAWGLQQGGRWQERLGFITPTAAAWRETAMLTAPALLVLLGLSWWSGRWDSVSMGALSRHFWMYPFWVVVQQCFLSCWFATVLGQAFNVQVKPQWLPVAGGLAGLGFSLLHFPNFGAMITVLFMGTGWACLWLRHRTIWPLIASHVLLGTLFRLLMPADFRVDGDVGLMYFAWLWY
jgi:hypothetical protein